MDLRRDMHRDICEQTFDVMTSVLSKLRTFPAEDNYWLRDFPRGSCSVASWAVGSILRELGFGDWTLISGAADQMEDAQGWSPTHVWLELREDGRTLFSLDATADQFPQWESEPFVVEGESPLGQHFFLSRQETLVSQPWERMRDPLHTLPLEHVRRSLLADGGEHSA
ncbi:hypothetical protein [Nocardiopsis alba]|uniref:hypothetical protein n=1 Tax=Nocardiopsis alba TaxID=53437 RepID=UPI00131CD882|nr:hypothetical protein [Nocardiopsis alba]